MNRKQVIDFCNADIFPLIKNPWITDCRETALTVERWRRAHGWPATMAAQVVNGFLFLNGSKAGRIAYYNTPRPAYNGPDYEELILAEQENYMED